MTGADARPTGLHADAVAVVTAYAPTDPHQQGLRRQFLQHLADHPDGVLKQGPPAHLTASCFVLDEAGSSVLLTLHRKGRFWVQVGGHLEPGDASVAGAALREATEETGVPGLRLRPGPVELHRHRLTSAFGRCTEHLDVAFVATAPPGATPVVSDESEDVAWFSVDALPADAAPDLPQRLAVALRTAGSGA